MALSNILPGKRNSIKQSGGKADRKRPAELAAHAPMFARPGEPEPNCVRGERLQPGQAPPRLAASRTLAEARALGLSMPEALDLTDEEVQGLAGTPPESTPDQS